MEPISTLVMSVEAPYFALRSPPLGSKTVLSSWSLVVYLYTVYICALIARGKFNPELEFQDGTSSCFQAGTSSYHARYKYENIGYVQVPDDHLYKTYEYLNAYVPFVT